MGCLCGIRNGWKESGVNCTKRKGEAARHQSWEAFVLLGHRVVVSPLAIWSMWLFTTGMGVEWSRPNSGFLNLGITDFTV